MALIEIDASPIRNGGSFHGELLVITRWYQATFKREKPARYPRLQGILASYHIKFIGYPIIHRSPQNILLVSGLEHEWIIFHLFSISSKRDVIPTPLTNSIIFQRARSTTNQRELSHENLH